MAIYMHIDGIEGGVTTKGYEGWIEISHLSHGINRPVKKTIAGNVRNRAPGANQLSDVEIYKPIDQSSSYIYQHCCAGDVLDEVQISLVKTGASIEPYLEYTLN